jgi:DNA modification methylase
VTGSAAAQHGRSAMLIELSEVYVEIIRKSLRDRLTEPSAT